MFLFDGKWFVFLSNRATKEGAHDTNVFLAKWTDAPIQATETGADRTKADATWLADPARQVGDAVHRREVDRPVAHGRAEHAPSRLFQQNDQGIQTGEVDTASVGGHGSLRKGSPSR